MRVMDSRQQAPVLVMATAIKKPEPGCEQDEGLRCGKQDKGGKAVTIQSVDIDFRVHLALLAILTEKHI